MKNAINKLMLLSSTSLVLTTNLLANAANLPPMDAAPVFVPAAAPASCSNCATPDARINIRSGLYGGLQGGYEHVRNNYKSAYTNNAGNAPVVTSSSVSVSKGGFVGEVLLGGRMVYSNCFVAGLEASAVFGTGKSNRNLTFGADNLNYKAKRKVSFVPSVVLGWLINDSFMLYTKTGLVVTQLETVVTHAAIAPRQKFSKNALGVAPAVGLEFGFNKLLSIRGEVGAELFSKRSKTLTFGQDTLALKVKTNSINAKLGLIVKL